MGVKDMEARVMFVPSALTSFSRWEFLVSMFPKKEEITHPEYSRVIIVKDKEGKFFGVAISRSRLHIAEGLDARGIREGVWKLEAKKRDGYTFTCDPDEDVKVPEWQGLVDSFNARKSLYTTKYAPKTFGVYNYSSLVSLLRGFPVQTNINLEYLKPLEFAEWTVHWFSEKDILIFRNEFCVAYILPIQFEADTPRGRGGCITVDGLEKNMGIDFLPDDKRVLEDSRQAGSWFCSEKPFELVCSDLETLVEVGSIFKRYSFFAVKKPLNIVCNLVK